MKLPQATTLLITATAYLAFSVSVIAQTAAVPTRAAASDPQENTVKLDPFSVSADSDVGFVAASSLAGGRMATALKDTPVAYSVIT